MDSRTPKCYKNGKVGRRQIIKPQMTERTDCIKLTHKIIHCLLVHPEGQPALFWWQINGPKGLVDLDRWLVPVTDWPVAPGTSSFQSFLYINIGAEVGFMYINKISTHLNDTFPQHLSKPLVPVLRYDIQTIHVDGGPLPIGVSVKKEDVTCLGRDKSDRNRRYRTKRPVAVIGGGDFWYGPFWWPRRPYGLQTVLEVRYDLRFEISDPKYLHIDVHITYMFWAHL